MLDTIINKVRVEGVDGDGASTPVASEATVKLLSRIVKLLESSAVVDSGMRQRIAVETIAGTTLGASVTGLSSGAGVPTVNYPTALAPQSYASTSYWLPVWTGPVDQRYQIIDAARTAFATGIRSKLVFS